MLGLIDVLVIDLQDVGARIYTFIYTMANCLRAAARHGLPVIVCDRPNPIGGGQVEGPTLEPGFESFVGQFRMPMRHGMTVAELARFFNEHHGINAALEVFPMEGWSRDMYWDATDLPWVMPSPNMPTLDTAIVYPGTVLVRRHHAVRGARHHASLRADRGTMARRRPPCRTHEPSGAKGRALPLGDLRADLPEARPRHLRRLPDPCHEPRGVPAGEGGRVAAPRMLRLRRRTASNGAIRLTNTSTTRCPSTFSPAHPRSDEQIEQQVPLEEIVASWRPGVAEFAEIRRKFLLY